MTFQFQNFIDWELSQFKKVVLFMISVQRTHRWSYFKFLTEDQEENQHFHF